MKVKNYFLLSHQYYIVKLSTQIINGIYFMRYSAPCTLKNIFDNACEHSILKYLQKKSKQLIYLDQVVKSVLPLHLHSCCRVINFHQGRLSLAFANAPAMNRLRYEKRILFSLLQSLIPSLIGIDLSINPSLQMINNYPCSTYSSSCNNNIIFSRTISHQSAAILRKVAIKCPEKIKSALERLASLATD
ncbi:MAG: DciA family protein [Candidatus Dasytiphilus stammeri]